MNATSANGTSRQLVRWSDTSEVGSKPDSSPTVSIRRSGLKPTFVSDPFARRSGHQGADFIH
jgi:hypothetical protein